MVWPDADATDRRQPQEVADVGPSSNSTVTPGFGHERLDHRVGPDVDGHADGHRAGVHHRHEWLLDLAVDAERRERGQVRWFVAVPPDLRHAGCCHDGGPGAAMPGSAIPAGAAKPGAGRVRGDARALRPRSARAVGGAAALVRVGRGGGRDRRDSTSSDVEAGSTGSSRPGWSATATDAVADGMLTPTGGPKASAAWPPSSTRPAPGRSSPAPTPGSWPSTSRCSTSAPTGSCARSTAAPVVNDHTDPATTTPVHGRGSATLDDAVQPVVAELAEALDRFGGYGPRLAGALAEVRGRRRRLVHQADDRLVPHRLVRAAREPAGHARHRAARPEATSPTQQEAT